MRPPFSCSSSSIPIAGFPDAQPAGAIGGISGGPVAVNQPGAAIPSDDVRRLLRGHQLRRRRRPLPGEGEEPLVRVPGSADGMAQGDGRGARRQLRGPDRSAAPARPTRTTSASPPRPAPTASPTTGSAASASRRARSTPCTLLARRVSPEADQLAPRRSSRTRATRRPARRDDRPAHDRVGRRDRRDSRRRRPMRPRPLPRARRRARARSTSTWCRCSRPTPGSSDRTACAPISSSCSPI